MNRKLIQKLRSWADQYETRDFISTDPVQFPRSFFDTKASIQDIEISAFVTSWLAYGNRKQIIAKAQQLHLLMEWQPLEYIRSKRWAVFLSDDRTLYRFYKWSDFAALCQRLESVYRVESRSMGQVITKTEKSPLCAIIDLFQGVKGVPKTDDSACKRLCMFLRWSGLTALWIWVFGLTSSASKTCLSLLTRTFTQWLYPLGLLTANRRIWLQQ